VKRTILKQKGTSDTALIKDKIQNYVREIVIRRDGGCIFADHGRFFGSGIPNCNGYANNGHLILQADHLITRANSATYADTRLLVCICKGHHGWKKWNEKRYNELIRPLIGPDRCALWDKCHAARYTPTRMYASDWKKELAALKQELRNTQ